MNNFVVVGLGSMGKRHADSLRAFGKNVYVVDPLVAGKMGMKHNALWTLPSIQSSFDLQIHGAIIASPAEDHYHQAMVFLAAGIPVFVEKPMAMTVAQSREMVEMAQRKGVPLAVGYQLRFASGVEAMTNKIKDVATPHNQLLYATVRYGWDIKRWHLHRANGAPYTPRLGVLMEASHEIDLAIWMFGLPQSTLAMLSKNRDYGELEYSAHLLMSYKGGLGIDMHLDYIRPEYQRSLEVVMRNEIIRWECTADENEEAYRKEIAFFINACDSGTLDQASASGEDGVRVLEIVEATRKCQT